MLEAEKCVLIRQLRSLIPEASQEEENFTSIWSAAHLMCPAWRRQSGGCCVWTVRTVATRYDVGAFQRELCRKWHHLHTEASPPSLRVAVPYWNSPLASIREVRLRDHLRLIAKCSIGPSLAGSGLVAGAGLSPIFRAQKTGAEAAAEG